MAKDIQSLWPREHGAYAQLAVALVCGVALGHGFRGVSQAVLTVTLFLASEPVLVLLGRRGEAARQSAQVRAALRLLIYGSLVILAALGALAGAPGAHLLSLFPPAILGAALFALFLFRLERTAAGEVVAAWVFSTAAGSVVLLGGGGAWRGTLLTLMLAALFTLATAVVHCHLVALRRGGAWGPRFAAFALGAAVTTVAFLLSLKGSVPRLLPAALLPMTCAAFWVWAAPPAPSRLKNLGWAATACALAGGALAVACLR
jgi:hypothetical protein